MFDSTLEYRVALLGVPNSMGLRDSMWYPAEWSVENLKRLMQLGFNTVQLNLAWGARPGDEPLNIEDVIRLEDYLQEVYPQPVPLRSDPNGYERRRSDLRTRSELCKSLGLRTVFHFGMPYNAHGAYGDTPPNCIMDDVTISRHIELINRFAEDFPLVDDILVYTYDQDAWLCGEFGNCPRCVGIPLHKRLPGFLNPAIRAWHNLRPGGRLWWEPWELSAGQVYKCIHELETDGLGLALHANIAEVMAALPVDRWLKNTCSQAREKNIPVIVEYFLGAASEELEPLINLSHPLVTLRALKAITSVPGVCGIKEYYGLAPTKEDPNLEATGIFFDNPDISEQGAIDELIRPYGNAASGIREFWQLTSSGMEFFPWDVSWMIRQIGRSRVDHSMSAAAIRGMYCSTPSWESTRGAIFMLCWADGIKPWCLEDIQLRCEEAAQRWESAYKLGETLITTIPNEMVDSFRRNLIDLGRLFRRAKAYAYHLRETNLATVIRSNLGINEEAVNNALEELKMMMRLDFDNYLSERVESPVTPVGDTLGDWTDMEEALDLLDDDVSAFLRRYLIEVPDSQSKGIFSATSR